MQKKIKRWYEKQNYGYKIVNFLHWQVNKLEAVNITLNI